MGDGGAQAGRRRVASQLREAQLKQAQAQRRLADNSATVVTLVYSATRAARYGESTNEQAAVRK